MNIYQDTKTKTWYISTKVKVNNEWKTCKIRGFKTLGEAKVLYDSSIEKWKSEHLGTNKNIVFFQNIAETYIEYVKNGKSPRTADRERTQLNTYWLPILKYLSLNDIFIPSYLSNLYLSIKENDSLNERKKHDVVYTFLQIANYCYIHHHITKEMFEETNIVFQPIKYTKAVKQERRIIPQCDLDHFLDKISHKSKADYILFGLLVNCGLRVSELLGLCSDCIKNGKVIVKRQLLVTGKLSNKLKTNNSYRQVPISANFVDELEQYVKKLKDNRLFDISHSTFKRKLAYYENKAKIDDYTAHEFRHTRCYQLARKCETISDVVYCAKVMGHSPTIFMNTYCSHLDKSLEAKFF